MDKIWDHFLRVTKDKLLNSCSIVLCIAYPKF